MRLVSVLAAPVAAMALLAATSCSRSGSEFPVRTYSMGEKVRLGSFVYTVFESQWHTQLGQGVEARVPEHRFFLVRMSVVNGGSEELIVPSLTLVNDKNETFLEVSKGDQVPNWAGFLRQVKPAESIEGNVAFDVNPGHYKLRVTDETEQRAALIDIPLTFGAETPEVPVPQEPPKR